jgi:hypothetical protein
VIRSKMTRRKEDLMSMTIRRSVTAVLAVCLLLTWSTAAALATPQGYHEQDHDVGRFYGNFEQGVLLFTEHVEPICTGAPEPVVPARVFHRKDGTVQVKVNVRELPIVLYRSPLGAPEFIDETCTALFDDDPATVPVQPFATGTANFKERITISPDGVEDHFNGVNGFATGTDGTTWKVRTWADFVIDDGVLIGDPAEFQGLAIHQIGR